MRNWRIGDLLRGYEICSTFTPRSIFLLDFYLLDPYPHSSRSLLSLFSILTLSLTRSSPQLENCMRTCRQRAKLANAVSNLHQHELFSGLLNALIRSTFTLALFSYSTFTLVKFAWSLATVVLLFKTMVVLLFKTIFIYCKLFIKPIIESERNTNSIAKVLSQLML